MRNRASTHSRFPYYLADTADLSLRGVLGWDRTPDGRAGVQLVISDHTSAGWESPGGRRISALA